MPDAGAREGDEKGRDALGNVDTTELYAGIVDVPEYGVRGRRGDFEPLISVAVFFKAPTAVAAAWQESP